MSLDIAVLIAFALVFSVVIAAYYLYSSSGSPHWKRVRELTTEQSAVVLCTFLAGIVAALVGLVQLGALVDICRWQLVFMLMVPIAYIDWRDQVIPNILLVIGLAMGIPLVALDIFLHLHLLTVILFLHISGALVASCIFLLSHLVTRGGVGAGDIKLFFVLGLILGLRGVFSVLLYSIIVSAITGVALLLTKRKKARDFLPMAPFVLIGTLLSIMLGV